MKNKKSMSPVLNEKLWQLIMEDVENIEVLLFFISVLKNNISSQMTGIFSRR